MKNILFNLTMLFKQHPDYESLSLKELHVKYVENYSEVNIRDLQQVLDFIIFGTIQDIPELTEDFELLNKYDNETM